MGNILSLGAVRGLEFIVPLIALPYLISTLGVTAFGLIEFALSLAMYFGSLINYGFRITAVRTLALVRGDIQKTAEVFSETYVAALLIAAACGLLYGATVYSVPSFRSNAALFLLSFLQVALNSLFPIWFFRGIEQISVGAVLTASARVMYLLGIFIFVSSDSSVAVVPGIYSASLVLSNFLALIVIRSKFNVRFHCPSPMKLWKVYKSGFNAFLAQVSPTLYNNSSTFLLGLLAGPTMVGIYSAAKKVVEVFNTVGMVISSALFPYLLRNPHQVPRAHTLVWIAAFLLWVACVVTADSVAALLFSDAPATIAPYIRLFSLGILAYFGIAIYHTNGLLLTGKDRIVRRIAVFVSLTFFLVGAVLVFIWGINGAIIMVTGARVLMALLGYYYYRQQKSEGC